MKHKISKTKIRFGVDANNMLLRKLSVNFLAHGHITTTKAKAKVLKSYLDHVLNKVKVDSEANRKIVFKTLQSQAKVDQLFNGITEEAKKIEGSFLSIKPVKIRRSDSAPMVKVTWAHTFLKPAEEVIAKPPKAAKKPTTKKAAPKVAKKESKEEAKA